MEWRIVERSAMIKYIHVGHARVSFAHAVRLTGPDGVSTVRYVFCVERNLASVIDIRMRTPIEMSKARMRDIMRSRRILALSF